MLSSTERNGLFQSKINLQRRRSFLMIGKSCEEFYIPLLKTGEVQHLHNLADLNKYIAYHKEDFPQVEVILIDVDQDESILLECLKMLKQYIQPLSRYIGITREKVEFHAEKIFRFGFKDVYHVDDDPSKIIRRIDLIKSFDEEHFEYLIDEEKNLESKTRISFRKRVFDVFFASLALFLVSPLMIIIAILIKLESKGPVFFISPRAGTGFRIFNFYKFRSMKTGSEAKLSELLHYNQYGQKAEISSFVKLRNDPRVTRIGWLLRKTSLDELPQLINVIKGDMSIVGNRPLPLYEAESLTRDEIVKRFFAPAGITGLWQVSKRGKKEMSAEERLALDVSYANQRNGWFDLRILWKTLPAMIQEEEV